MVLILSSDEETHVVITLVGNNNCAKLSCVTTLISLFLLKIMTRIMMRDLETNIIGEEETYPINFVPLTLHILGIIQA